MDLQVFVGSGARVGKDVWSGHDGALGPVVTPEKRLKTVRQRWRVVERLVDEADVWGHQVATNLPGTQLKVPLRPDSCLLTMHFTLTSKISLFTDSAAETKVMYYELGGGGGRGGSRKVQPLLSGYAHV